MANPVRGSHFCIGIARTVADLAFRYLDARCISNGGTLSTDDLKEAHASFIGRFSSGFDFFEAMHGQCMQASESAAPTPFARDKILSSLLFACGRKAAKHAFANQVEHYGTGWIENFFAGLAHYIRQHVCSDVDTRLATAYVEAALKFKSKLSIGNLLAEDNSQHILRECLAPLLAHGAPDTFAEPLSSAVNEHIAKERAIAGPQFAKITSDQVKQFLTLLPNEIVIALSVQHSDAA